MLYAILAATSGSFATLLAKYELKSLEYHQYLTFSFLVGFVIMAFLSPWYFFVPKATLWAYGIFCLYIVNAITWNLLYYHGFSKENLAESQSLTLLAPLLTVVLATIFYPDERNYAHVGLAIIALSALLFAHKSHHAIRLHKGSKLIFVGVVFMAFESLLVKQLLISFTPFTLYFLRVGIMGLFLWSYFRPQLTMTTINLRWGLVCELFVVAQFMFLYTSYTQVGIVVTSLVMSIVPMTVYFFATYQLKEHISTRHVYATCIILICVLLINVV